MRLQPLEFADCLTDSPLFRTKLSEHERELERISKFIKQLVHHGRDVYNAAKQLSKAQRLFAKDMMEFKFECIGNQLTDDETFISQSLSEFGKFINKIEDHRDMMISTAEDAIMKPLENFRKESIGAAKEEKKNFDKHTTKFCQSLERYLNMKASKSNDSTMQEADTQVEFEKKDFYTSSMKYVLKLQEVQEKKKFEFVEILLSYMLNWLTFYHQGYADLDDFRSYQNMLTQLLQKTRENFECTKDEAQILMGKMLNENKGLKPLDQSGTLKGGFARQGYLYLMEKKTLGTTSWTKYYCQYKKETKEFFMILYNQIGGKLSEPEKFTLEKCVRRASDTIERRFCFDLTVKEKSAPMTLQSLSQDDRQLWLDAMDGKEPTYPMHKIKKEESMLDEIGFGFIRKSIAAIESRGLQDQGLYRVVGVNSKVSNLIKVALDPKKADKFSYDDQWETKTITSAVKNYLRSLPEPLMTFQLHESFIRAAKQESKTLRILDVHKYVHQLPQSSFEMLDLLIAHLKRVADKCDVNRMNVANLGVCFGPSLMRPEEETMAAVLDIKFCNIVVEILINNYDQIFKNIPDGADPSESRVLPNTNQLVTSKPPTPQGVMANRNEPSPRSPQSQNINHTATPNKSSRTYASPAMGHSSGPSARLKQRPAGTVNANTGGLDVHSSTSSSTESLSSAKNSLSPRLLPGGMTPQNFDGVMWRGPTNMKDSQPGLSNVSALAARFSMNMASSDSPALSSSTQGSLTGSVSSLSSKPNRRTVITRYRCVAEHDTELSFEANQLITNVRPSREPGWLEGTLDGKTGIIPENYIEYLE